jgi:hypothetical protein
MVLKKKTIPAPKAVINQVKIAANRANHTGFIFRRLSKFI